MNVDVLRSLQAAEGTIQSAKAMVAQAKGEIRKRGCGWYALQDVTTALRHLESAETFISYAIDDERDGEDELS